MLCLKGCMDMHLAFLSPARPNVVRTLRALPTLRRTRSQARWVCSQHRRRKNVGVPKNVLVGPPAAPLTAEESPWEDYLIPDISGNSTPLDSGRYTSSNPFLVLGVESSCDDTAAAVIRSDGNVLSDVRISQHELTEIWGGVVPHVARDAHTEVIQNVIHSALLDASITATDLDAVAATMGPGLEICLRVGYRAARQISRDFCKDFVAVNHLEAHVMVARMLAEQQGTPTKFPFLTLLISGGHCQLLLAYDVANYEILGGTLDDALGEAYDKTARLLGLQVGGGGGPALERLAHGGDPFAIPFPVPMAKRQDCNFSFAGLKTSVRVAIDKLGGDDAVRASDKLMADVAASFQETAVRHLEQRVRRALRVCDENGIGADTLVVSGGVAANKVIRARLEKVCENTGWRCLIPPVGLCTDNGVMVAWAGVERLRKGIADETKNLDVRARWPLAGLGKLAVPLPPDSAAGN